MKFTENELTLAADAGGRFLFTIRQMPWRRADAASRWSSMRPVEKYPHRASAGAFVIASLAALPERSVPGKVPTFTDEELVEASWAGARAAHEARGKNAWDQVNPKRQKRLLTLSTLVTRAAVASLPPRVDPDAPIEVPDFIPDDMI